MESNKDEAIKCLAIAQKHRNASNFASARRFCQKSINLFSTSEALKLLVVLDSEEQEGPDASSGANTEPTASTSSTETHPSASGAHRRTRATEANGNAKEDTSSTEQKKSYTPEQASMVKRIRTCKVTEYYEILSLKRDCEEAEVKKAYRKLALGLHPDKNGAPGADEAFKMVSKAFQVLSDSQKRAIYDQHGSDPESRFGGQSSSSGNSPGFAGGTSFGGGFEGELSPEDLFNMFFGGGQMGGATFGGSFGGGPIFTTFGPGGFRTTRVRTGGAPQQQQNNQPRSMIMQLLPLFILFGFTLLNALPSLFSMPTTPDPHVSFSTSSRFNVERRTAGLGVKYHVNSAEFTGHPIGAELARDKTGGPLLKTFERKIERDYTQSLLNDCRRGMRRKETRKEEEVGIFGIGTDWNKVKGIEEERIPSCDELRSLGVLD